MSRSFKKNPVIKDKCKAKKEFKRKASKSVRKSDNLSNGNAYKKTYNSYNINDYIEKKFLKNNENWFKIYKRK